MRHKTQTTIVQCQYCGKDAFQKTKKQRSFCSIKCKAAFYIRLPEVRAKTRAKYTKTRRAIIKAYGGRCECCGETTYEFLAIDHKDGGGTKERKLKGSVTIREITLKELPSTLRVLCHNCNSAKGFYGYCPHEKL